MKTSVYDAIDRDMSSWVVSSTKDGTRLYLTDEGLATDRPSLAMRLRWRDEAETQASVENCGAAWQGFNWKPLRVAAMMGG